MTAFICATCGAQFAPSAAPPSACPICQDERQYVPAAGQRWTTLPALRGGYGNVWRQHEADLFGIGTAPVFAIGQRALLLRTPRGNVLWDCISLLDDATVTLVRALGGIAAIAISHPHYYASMVEWAHAFDAPIWLHGADKAHIMRPDPAVRHWSGPHHDLLPGVRLLHAPGHFDGATLLHWDRDGGALLTGDIFQVSPDRATVGFMRSYPNYIPLSPRAVRHLADVVAPYDYTRVYGPFFDRVIAQDGKAAVARSVARTLEWLAR